MSKFVPKRTFPPEKNIFISQTIPETFKDQIRTLSTSGEYGKLKELLLQFPVNLNFAPSLLHGIIQSTLTDIQKLELVKLLIEHGVSINNLDDNGLSALYYAIKLQIYDIVEILVNKNVNMNKLPNNYDYFRLALNPSIISCKSQMIGVQDQIYMSKYYSQQLKIERDFRTEMNKLQITPDTIQYLLDFVNNLPNQELRYYDASLNTIESTKNVKLEGEELQNILPPFENKLFYKLNEITDNLSSFLKSGAINEDQILSKKTELSKTIQSELKTLLNATISKSIPSLQTNFIYNNGVTPDQLYDTLFTPHEYNIREVFPRFKAKYSQIQEEIIRSVDDFRGQLFTLINELMTIEHNLSELYPVFKPIVSNETPLLVPNSLQLKNNSRLFYKVDPVLDNGNIGIGIQNFVGGKQMGGAIINKIINISRALDEELKKRGAGGIPIGDLELVTNCNTRLETIFSDPALNPIIAIVPAGDDFRVRIDNIKNGLNEFNTNLTNISLKGVEINTELNMIQLNVPKINQLFNEYNILVTLLQTIFDNISNNIDNPNPFNGKFDNLNNYILDIYEELDYNRGLPIAANPLNLIPIGLPLLNSHLYYNKLVPIFDEIQGRLGNEQFAPNDPNNEIDIIDKFRKTIFIVNSLLSIVKYSINTSTIKDEIENNFPRITALNNIIQTIQPSTINNTSLTIKSELREKFNEIEQFINVENSYIKQFNEFILDLNNITQITLLYEKLYTPVNKILSLNHPFVLYNPENIDYNNFNNLVNIYANEERLSLYSDLNNFFIYNNPPAAQILNYRLAVAGGGLPVLTPINQDNNIANFQINPPYNPLYLENNTLINLQAIALIYHEKVFKSFITGPSVEYTRIKNQFIADNPTILVDVIDKLLLKIIDDSIKNNFLELVNLTMFFAARNLIDNSLVVAGQRSANYNGVNIKDLLEKRLAKQDIVREVQNQQYYLDENYSSTEPIDIITCINNDVRIIKLLKNRMNVDVKEYQELIFKLGNPIILRELNTRNKITKVHLHDYRRRHTEKFNIGLTLLKTQLQQILKDSIFLDDGTGLDPVYIDNIPVAPINVNGTIYSYDVIYDDLINSQSISVSYMVKNIRDYLTLTFDLVIIPQVEKLLQFFTDTSLDRTLINLDNDIKPIIDNIIYYHLNIDPSKAKEQQIPLENSVNALGDLFINPLDEDNKQKLLSIYNERLKNKILDLLTNVSKYYLNVYRNHLKYIFNDVRYNRLDPILI